MDYIETDEQTLRENNVEEILSFVPSEEEVGQQFMFGNDAEEAAHCEGGGGQCPKGNAAAAEARSVACAEDTDRHNQNGNDNGDDDGIPRVGMKFSSEDEAYDFYNVYAASIGFSIRRGGIRHNTKGVVRQRTYVCSKEGLKLDEEYCGAEKSNKLETRTGCKASIRLNVAGGVWEVCRFNPDHNHELADLERRKYLRSTRKLFESRTDISAASLVDCRNLFESRLPVSMASPVDCEEGGIVRVPTVGMKVYSENETYSLYNLYATHIGFSIRKGGYRFNSKGELRQRNYVCSKQGLRVDDEPDRVRKVNRLETRTDCKASIRFTITDGVWEVTFFNPEHNHELVEPEQRKYLRSSRRVSLANAGLLTSMNMAGRRLMKSQSCLTDEVGRGANNARFQSGECHNLLETKRPYIIEAGDAQSVINQLKHKLTEDTMFFYSVQVDSHNHLANFFWRDGRSRLDYDFFGDVVVLDISFRTVKYDLVCAPFVGVNHHGKNVLFGCAILSDESVSSFSWLFETFLESMGERHPKTIFTSQSQALANAIEKALPRTCHRLCILNIQEYAMQHLPNLFSNPDFKAKFDKCLNDCHTEVEFQSTWDELIEGHAENEWLKALYDLRLKWCPIFSPDTFTTNVRFTQRADSMRNVFNHMSCKTMTLPQLVEYYEETAERMRLAELEEDVRCNQDLPTRVSRNSAMLKQAADVYTNEMFRFFQEEMVESLSIVMNELSSDGRLHTYELIEEGHSGGYIVHFDADNCTATCSCKMFESMGLLCRHALRVLNMKNVTKLPARYILKRWTKGARKGITSPDDGGPSCFNAKPTQLLVRSRLMHKAFCAVDKSLLTTKGSDIADTLLGQIIEQAEKEIASLNVKDIDNGDSESIDDGANDDTNDTPCSVDSSPLLDTSHARPKSQLQKKHKRKKSKTNISTGQQNQQVFVGPSGVLFHPQYPTFFRPSFHPAIVGINASPYALHQGHTPTWVLSNIRPPGVFLGTDQMPRANQRWGTSNAAFYSVCALLGQGLCKRASSYWGSTDEKEQSWTCCLAVSGDSIGFQEIINVRASIENPHSIHMQHPL